MAGYSTPDTYTSGEIKHYEASHALMFVWYYPDDLEPVDEARQFAREMDLRADASMHLLYVAGGASIVGGVAGGVACAYLCTTEFTTLGLGGPYVGYTNSELNALMGASQRELIRELLGRSVDGARQALESFRLPSELTHRSLEIYREIAMRVVAKGPSAPGYELQTLRLEIIERALRLLD